MTVLFYGSLLFGLGLVVHVVIWRVHLPKRQAKVIFLLFAGFLFCGSYILWKYRHGLSILGFHPPSDLAQYLQFWIYYVSLTLAYMITYSAIEADSPSLIIIMRIHEAGSSGLAKESLEGVMNDRILIEPRLKDLLVDKMADFQEGKYRLTKKGVLIARLFTFYRGIIKAGKGG
ncbi:MAG: hypothetical protein JRI70_03680 [Deltaproteobacteria bacterium]|nr:hypothetical protein [Deltaproteobacteria bacterium]MBW2170527.1 hypothetical protein [Deltaproteobacteria bacterium]